MRINNNKSTTSISDRELSRILGTNRKDDGECGVALTEAKDYKPTTENKKHFKLTDETIEYKNHILHRIQCTETFVISNTILKQYYDEDILTVKEGEFGGFVESENNLDDNAWIRENAKVFGDARVYSNAIIAGEAVVRDHADVRGNAIIHDNAIIRDNAEVYGMAIVNGNAKVCGYATVYQTSKVHDNAKICDHARVYGSACITERAIIDGYACVDNAHIGGDVQVAGDAQVSDIIIMVCKAYIANDANICQDYDYMCFVNVGSRKDTLTAYRTKHNGVRITVGCFFGDLDEFRKDVAKKGENEALIKKEYELIADVIQHRFINNNTENYLKNNKE